jgi:hypothetical protein
MILISSYTKILIALAPPAGCSRSFFTAFIPGRPAVHGRFSIKRQKQSGALQVAIPGFHRIEKEIPKKRIVDFIYKKMYAHVNVSGNIYMMVSNKKFARFGFVRRCISTYTEILMSRPFLSLCNPDD